MRVPRIKLAEQEKILLLAMGYLKEEENWVQGQWKCPAFADSSRRRQKKDKNGRPLYQYCIEGAVNQATHDVLGAERAAKLGAVEIDEEKNVISWAGNDELPFTPTALMGLDAISQKLYGFDAMEYNDLDPGDGTDVNVTHEGVLAILRTRLAAVQRRLRPKS